LPEREKRGCSFHHACDKKGSSSHVTSYSLFRRSRPGTRERLFIGDALNKRRIAPGLWTGSKGLREAIESHPHPWARTPTAGVLDSRVEPCVALRPTRQARVCGVAPPGRVPAAWSVCPRLAPTPWPGQAAWPGRPGSFARAVGDAEWAACSPRSLGRISNRGSRCP